MNNSKWPEATAVSATALAFACVLTPWDRIVPISWEALGAIATTAAVLAALGVPAWQRRVARRDAEVTALRHEFIASVEFIRMANAVRTTLTDWASFGGKPSESHILALRSELSIARGTTHTYYLRHMFADTSEILARIQSATSRTTGASGLMDGLSGMQLQQELDRELENLLQQGFKVQEELLEKFKRLGETPPT